MSRLELKELAKSQIKGNVIFLFVVTAIASPDIFFARFFFVRFLRIFMINALALSPALLNIFGAVMLASVLISVIICALKVSLAHIYLGISSGENPKFSMLGYGFKNCWDQSFLLSLFKSLFIILWMFLFIVPGIIKFYSYSMAEYIMAENPDIKGLDAITKSRQMMEGHKFKLFVLDLSFILWYLLIGITCGVAAIYVFPYVISTKTNFYLKLKEEQQAN